MTTNIIGCTIGNLRDLRHLSCSSKTCNPGTIRYSDITTNSYGLMDCDRKRPVYEVTTRYVRELSFLFIKNNRWDLRTDLVYESVSITLSTLCEPGYYTLKSFTLQGCSAVTLKLRDCNETFKATKYCRECSQIE